MDHYRHLCHIMVYGIIVWKWFGFSIGFIKAKILRIVALLRNRSNFCRSHCSNKSNMEIQDNHKIKDVENREKDIKYVHHSKGRIRYMHMYYFVADDL